MKRVTKAILEEKVKHINKQRWGHDGTDRPMSRGTFHLNWEYGQPSVYITTTSESHGGGLMVIPRGTKTEVAKGIEALAHGIRIGRCGQTAF